MKQLFIFLTFIITGHTAHAQYFQTGQDPASLRWKQIYTKNFQLIFPDYYEEQAKKLSGNLEAVYPYASFTLKHNPLRLPVILHTQTVQSNGLVAWAPKRAEFYTTPHQSMYPQDWLEQLALHEFRHVVQVDKIRSNQPKWSKLLLGEQGTALLFGAYLPLWFIEGDAVVTETALSNYGRGRLPSFLMEHRAQVVEKGLFSYDKAFFRSYRHFVPNHYNLGYYLAGNLRARHGSELWEEVLTRAGKKPLSIFPMNQVLKHKTGRTMAQNYYSVFDSLQNIWQKSDKQYNSIPFETVSKEKRYFTNYNHNYWLTDSIIISYKTAFNQIPSFVMIDRNQMKEKKVILPGSIFNESVGYRDEWIVWAEQISDVRWQHSGKSLIRIFNVNSGRKFEIQPEHKSFSPSISPDKTKLVVVETDFSNNYYLSVYQLPDGKLLERFQSQENNYFFSPEWLNNDEVAAVILTSNGKRLVRINFKSNNLEQLFDKELGDIKHLRVSDNLLYFIGTYSGKNSLYRLSLDDGLVEMVYEPRFGVESPAISTDGSQIALSNYTADGFKLIVIPAMNKSVKKLDEVNPHKYILADILTSQETGYPVFPNTTSGNYKSENYSKTGHLFKFHSWGPLFVDLDFYEFYPGVSLMSQNDLGTSETVIGYRWDHSEDKGRFMFNYSYKGWYPVIDLDLSFGERASYYNSIRQVPIEQGAVRQDTVQQMFDWLEATAEMKMKLPLTFNKGPFNRHLQPEVQYGINYIDHNESTPSRFHRGSFHSLAYRLYFQQLLRRSYMDMYPDFGFIFDGTFRHSPAGSIRAGQIKALQSVLYLPSFMKNHGIKLYAGAQQKESSGTMGFSDVVRYARGWGRISTTSVSTGGVDYKFPLFYPDLNLRSLLYTRRVTAALFADYSRLKGNFYQNGNKTETFNKDISSLGAEITADFNMFRIYAPVTMGFRASYLPELKNVYFDFLYSIDFTSF